MSKTQNDITNNSTLSQEHVAIYLRKSREAMDTDDTLESHRNRLIELAESKGYSYTIYEEIGSSMDEDRPELNKMLNDINSGTEYTKVLVTETSRLSRSTEYSAHLFKFFKSHNIFIETPTEVINPADKMQKMFFSLKQIFAELEYDTTSERQSHGRFDAIKKGHAVYSTAPLGYKYNRDTKKLEVNPEESKIIRKAVEMILAGHTLNETKDALNSLGWFTKRGKRWTSATLSRTIRNEVYIGVLEQKSRKKSIDRQERFEDAHEKLISEAKFEQIQKMLSSRSTTNRRTKKSAKVITDKLYVCGCCNKGMTVQETANKSKIHYHIKSCIHYDAVTGEKCSNRRGYTVEKIEAVVFDELKLQKSKLIESLQKLSDKDTSGLKHKLEDIVAGLEKDLSSQEIKEDRLQDMYLDGDLTKEKYNNKKDEIKETSDNLSKELKSAKNKLRNMDVTAYSNKLESHIQLIDELVNKRDTMDIAEQNRLMKMIIDKIVYKREKHMNEPEIQIEFKSV